MMKKSLSVMLSALLLLSLSLTAWAGYAALLPGDVNGNGKHDPMDARLILRVSVRLENLTATQKQLADVDGDGQITPRDSRLVLRASVKLEQLEGDGKDQGEDPPMLTDREAFGLWKAANTVYAGWLIMPLDPTGKGIVDENDYFVEEHGLRCYRVIGEGIRSKAQLSDFLSRYFEPEVYEIKVNSDRYVEKDGSLYILVDGIGECDIIGKSLRVKSQTGSTAVIELGFRDAVMGRISRLLYELHYRDGVWRFADPFICCYDDMTYSHIIC